MTENHLVESMARAIHFAVINDEDRGQPLNLDTERCEAAAALDALRTHVRANFLELENTPLDHAVLAGPNIAKAWRAGLEGLHLMPTAKPVFLGLDLASKGEG